MGDVADCVGPKRRHCRRRGRFHHAGQSDHVGVLRPRFHRRPERWQRRAVDRHGVEDVGTEHQLRRCGNVAPHETEPAHHHPVQVGCGDRRHRWPELDLNRAVGWSGLEAARFVGDDAGAQGCAGGVSGSLGRRTGRRDGPAVGRNELDDGDRRQPGHRHHGPQGQGW